MNQLTKIIHSNIITIKFYWNSCYRKEDYFKIKSFQTQDGLFYSIIYRYLFPANSICKKQNILIIFE